jgi:hypothetical protein
LVALSVLEQAAEDSAASAARKLAQGAVTESNEMTVDSFFKAFKEAPGKLLSRFGVGAPEEIEMETRYKRHWQSYRLCLVPIQERSYHLANTLIVFDSATVVILDRRYDCKGGLQRITKNFPTNVSKRIADSC